jgi:hypothetical protein
MVSTDVKALIETLMASSESVTALGTVYSAVALAFIGYIFAFQRPIQVFKVRLALVFVFLIFAFSHWHSFIREQSKYVALSRYAVSELRRHPEVRGVADAIASNMPSSPTECTVYLILLDLVVVAFILLAPEISRDLRSGAAGYS